MQMPTYHFAVYPLQRETVYLPSSSAQQDRATVEISTRSQSAESTNVPPILMEALTILVPVSFLVGILIHRRLRMHALQRKIAMLEKLWQLNCHKKI